MMQKEHLETRYALYNTQLQLEKERGVSYELKMQLKTALNVMNQLEQQQTKNQIESVELQVKYDAMSKQFDSLMNQTTSAKAREIEYKMKIQSLEEALCQRDTTNKRLEQMLKEFEHNNLRTINAIDQYVLLHIYITSSKENFVLLHNNVKYYAAFY